MMDETGVVLLQGDCRQAMATLPAESVHCVVTSPPYYALRDYNVEGQIGLENSPTEYLETMVDVFRGVRRVLRKDGIAAVNMGDCYVCSPNGRSAADTKALGRDDRTFRDKPWADFGGLAPKNLMMMPSRLAIALQSDGWILRSMLSWVKRSAMPESATDRPSTAVEYVFIFAKSNKPTFWTHRDGPGSQAPPAPDYRWVNEKTGEERLEAPADPEGWKRINLWRGHDYYWDQEAVRRPHAVPLHAPGNKFHKEKVAGPMDRGGHSQWERDMSEVWGSPNGRNLRNSDFYFDSLDLAIEATRQELAHLLHLRERGGLLLSEDGEPLALDVNPQALADAHFASFPEKLVAPLILAGTSEAGCCAACGAPWVRQVKKDEALAESRRGHKDYQTGGLERGSRFASATPGYTTRAVTTGWKPSCKCGTTEGRPCVVLDPFAGSGTVSLVATKLGRRSIGIELSEAYGDIFSKRNAQLGLYL